MKTYLIPIGENEELSERVQKALFAAGFQWSLAYGGTDSTVSATCSGTLSVNSDGAGLLTHSEFGDPTFINTEPSSDVLLAPSYVLAHASELDGAKKVFETAPAGYKLVTDEERRNNKIPECAIGMAAWEKGWDYRRRHLANCWSNEICMSNGNDPACYSVPLSFTFPPPVVRMTHAQICKALGKDIEIIKESK